MSELRTVAPKLLLLQSKKSLAVFLANAGVRRSVGSKAVRNGWHIRTDVAALIRQRFVPEK